MSGIGGPGGVGGPKGPDGPDELDGPDALDEAGAPDAAASVASNALVDQLAAEIAAGRLTPREAVDQLVDLTAGPGMDAAERAELRELLTDLVANDPYLGGLVGRV